VNSQLHAVLLELWKTQRNTDKITMIWKVHSEYQQNLPVSIVLDNKPTPSCWGQSGIVPKEGIAILAYLQEGFGPAVTSSK